MADASWTRAEVVVCPDCGLELGRRTLAQNLIVTFDPQSLRQQCIQMKDGGSPDVQCPRFDEVKLAADQSDRVHPADEPPQA